MNNDNTQTIFVEYIWIDGCNSLRSKNRTLNLNIDTTKGNHNLDYLLPQIPDWNYDGSSTNQATTEDSEVMLKPIRIYYDPFMTQAPGIFVLCETFTNGVCEHSSNTRQLARKAFKSSKFPEKDYWFGLEQEFFLFDINSNKPLGFPQSYAFNPGPQGPYYCSVGGENTYGRNIVQNAYILASKAGIDVSGMNAEVAPGQWEIQVGIAKGLKAGDDLWMLRYILHRIAEMNQGVRVEFHAKPIMNNRYQFDQRWNGSGLHTNFSTPSTRSEDSGYLNIVKIINNLEEKHEEHINSFGEDNELRLTGKLETSSISKFSSSVGGRNTSIRIPNEIYNKGCGYFEDRRPSSSADPYLIIKALVESSNI